MRISYTQQNFVTILPPLLTSHKAHRLPFVTQMKTWEYKWMQVFFSDENKSNLNVLKAGITSGITSIKK